MKNKVKRLLIGSVIVIGVCVIAIKVEIVPIVSAKIADLMTDTKVIYYNQGKSPFARAAVSPDRKQLAFCLGDQEFSVQELSTGKITTYPVTGNVCQVKYSPDGRYLAAGRNILNTETGEVTPLSTQAKPSTSFDEIAFSTNGELLAIVNKERALHPTRPTVIEIWNLQSKQLIQKFTKDRFLIYQMSFSPDGHYLAVAGNAISLWDIKTGKCVKTLMTDTTPSDNILEFHTEYRTLDYSPDGRHLAAVLENQYSSAKGNGSQTQGIEIWDVEQEKVVKTLDGGPYMLDQLKYSPDGQFIATGRTIYDLFDMISDAVWIWDVNRGEVVKKLTQFPYGTLTGMDYSADGNYVSADGDYYTKIWKIK